MTEVIRETAFKGKYLHPECTPHSASQDPARYRVWLEGAPDAMVVVGKTGQIVLFNLQAEKEFGYHSGELLGLRVNSIFPEGLEEGLLSPSAVNEVGQMHAMKLLCRRKDGSVFPAEVTMRSVQSPEGLVSIASVRNLSFLDRGVSEKVRDLDRSRNDMEEFARVASHDFQEPLRMVTCYTQLLARRYKGQLDSDADEFITFALDGTERMKAMLEGLLLYSRAAVMGKTNPELESGQALEEALENLKAKIRASETVVTHDELPKIAMDKLQLVQLFENLIGNAIKYRGTARPHVHISATRRDAEWVFSVQDNGLGIEAQHLDRIFVIFQRLHSRNEIEGNGVGLAICKKIVERRGGKIWVESEAGRSSTFYFSLGQAEANHGTA